MANRSYLYSTNRVPSPEVRKTERRLTGISEWNYDIPIIFKILLSGNPRKCPSSIWEVPEEIAIVGDYDQGLAHLFRFLDRITVPEIAPLRKEAHLFLTTETNKNRYFVLECGEIFEMHESPLADQNDCLLAEIQNLESAMESALAFQSHTDKKQPKFTAFFTKMFGSNVPPSKEKNPRKEISTLGLGNWSNTLYFDLSNEQ